MLISFSFESYDAAWKAITDEQWASLREVIPALDEKKPDYTYKKYVADAEGVYRLAAVGAKISLAQLPDDYMMFVRMADRIDKLEMKTGRKDWAKELASGATVQIHIPDHSLMKINNVMYMEDACTDNLQGYLDKGWRILAVCPPNAQRRPDYILGRMKVIGDED